MTAPCDHMDGWTDGRMDGWMDVLGDVEWMEPDLYEYILHDSS